MQLDIQNDEVGCLNKAPDAGLDKALSLKQRLRPLQDRVLARPATGLDADKAYYDELSGDL